MKNHIAKEMTEQIICSIRIKSSERDCPKCSSVLVLNENEQCFECLNCGYIDCGDEE